MMEDDVVRVPGPSLRSRVLAGGLRLSGIRRRQFDPDRFRNARRRPVGVPASVSKRVRVSEWSGAPWPIFVLDPGAAENTRDILYLHGGAYAAEIVGPQWNLAATLAVGTGRRVVVAIYPLAPEHNHQDVLPALTGLYAELSVDAAPTLLGDSAGAGLALALAQTLPTALRPDRLVLLSPYVDATLTNPDIPALERRDPLLVSAHLAEIGRWWAGTADPSSPAVSPLYGDMSELPPMAVFAGTRDLLTPDALVLRDKVAAAGGRIDFTLYEGMFHDWMLLPGPESRDVRRRLADLLQAGARTVDLRRSR